MRRSLERPGLPVTVLVLPVLLGLVTWLLLAWLLIYLVPGH